MILWFKNQKLKDSQEIQNSKKELIDEIKGLNPKEIKNNVQEVKKYTLWERLKRVLGNN